MLSRGPVTGWPSPASECCYMSYISKPADEADRRPGWDIPKQRDCMRCKSTFRSEWAGERICRRCKQSKSWRDGIPMPTSGVR